MEMSGNFTFSTKSQENVSEFCIFNQKSGKCQGILKKQVNELHFPSGLDFTIIE